MGFLAKLLSFIASLSPPDKPKMKRRGSDLDVADLLARPSHDPRKPKKLKVNIEGPGEFGIHVVGASRYQDNIQLITGPKTPEGFDELAVAVLELEDNNPHDPKAVRVDIDGLTVGYLSRENARAYRKMLRLSKAPSHPLKVSAKIVGGWDRGKGDTGHFGVRIDLPCS